MLKKVIYILIILIAGIQCSDPPDCDISILFPDHTFVENGGWQDIYFIPYSDDLSSCNELLVLSRDKLIEYSETYATIPIVTSPLTGKDFSGLKGNRYYIIVRAKDTKCDLQWERCKDVDLSIDCATTLEIDLNNKSTNESCNGMCLEGKCEQIPCEENEDCLNENTCDGIEYCGSDNICHSGQGLSAGNHCNDDNDITTDQICISGRCVESKCGDGYLDKDMEEECEPPDTEQCGSDCKTINLSDAGNDADSDSDTDSDTDVDVDVDSDTDSDTDTDTDVDLDTDNTDIVDPCESIDCGVNATCNENYECVCNTGFERCGGDIDDGCPINLNTDPNNCTACGNSCGENAICSNGCVCNSGYLNCNTTLTDGCECTTCCDGAVCVTVGNGNTGEPCCETCAIAKHTECTDNQCVCKSHYTDCDNNGSCECGGLCNASECSCGTDNLLDCNYDGTCECNTSSGNNCSGTTCCPSGTADCNQDGTCECNTSAGYFCEGSICCLRHDEQSCTSSSECCSGSCVDYGFSGLLCCVRAGTSCSSFADHCCGRCEQIGSTWDYVCR